MTFADTQQLILSRRSIYPHSYNKKLITQEVVMELLELAQWAPTHRKTEPWRFKVFHSEDSRKKLSIYLGEQFLKANSDKDYPIIKYKKTIEKPLQSSCVLAICMERDAEQRIPEWEEIAAVACAVQNMWLGCTSLGIGAYWSTPSAIIKADQFLELQPSEKCLGLFYMGYHDNLKVSSSRESLHSKVEFM